MADKTSVLNVEYSKYSINGEYNWYDDDGYLYYGRSSTGQYAGYYWFSKVCFNTNGLNFKQSKHLDLVFTTYQTSFPWGTSAIITTTELSPSEVHNLTSLDKVQAVSGFVAHFEADVGESNISSGTVVRYPLDTDKLKPNTTYYLYMKRYAGWANTTANYNGWTCCYSPATYPSYSYIELTYEAGGYVNIHNGTEFKKYSVYIHNGTEFKRYVPYIHNGTKWVQYSG